MSFTWHVTSLLNYNWNFASFIKSQVLTCVVLRVFVLGISSISKPATHEVNIHICPADIIRMPAQCMMHLTNSSVCKSLCYLVSYFLASFGLLAPYLERAWRLLATPAVSKVPLTIWYLVPGKSLTRPPRINTTLCS